MAQYRYLPYGTSNNLPVEPGTLPLDVQSIRWERRQPGALRARLQLAGQDPDLLDELVDATDPARRSLYVERDGVLIWGGLIWQAIDTNGGRALDIGAEGFFSYFERCPIVHDLPLPDWPVPINTLTAMRHLINWWQTRRPDMDIKVVTGTENGGITWGGGPYWRGKEMKAISTAIEDIAKLDPFDWEIVVRYEDGLPVRRFQLWMPRQGRRFDARRSPFWEIPSDAVISSPWGRDASKMANCVFTLGAGEGATMNIGWAQDWGNLREGYPLLAAVIPYKDEGNASILNQRARSDLGRLLNPDLEASVTVRADADPVFGSYGIGDEARFFARTPRFPAGRDVHKTIEAIELHPGKETVTLDLSPIV